MDKFVKVTIHDKELYQLVDEKYLGVLQKYLNSYWNINKVKYFPGPNPVSIFRKDLKVIKDSEYLITEKTDGQRYLLLFVNIENKNMCILLDRKFNAYLMDPQAPPELYTGNGTCFDGELVDFNNESMNSKKTNAFYIFDCISICGMNVRTQKFSQRIHHVNHLLKSVPLQCSLFKMCLKTFWHKSQISELFQSIETREFYKTDGLIFMPENTKIKSSRQHDLFKWKPTEENTIDFHIKRTPNTIDEFTFYIYCVESKKLEPVQTVIIKDPFKLQIIQMGVHEDIFKNVLKDSQGNSTNLLKMFKVPKVPNVPKINHSLFIFECKYDPVSQLWDIIKFRNDKHHPNDSITYRNTVVNIQENITKEELINYFNN